MATLEQIDIKLDKMDNRLVRIETVLLGANSDKGLVGQVNSNTKKINRNSILLAALFGGGFLGGGAATWKVLELIQLVGSR